MLKKKVHNPEKQFRKLTQQYFALFNNLTNCTNEHNMRLLLKRHNKVIKRIGQDQLNQEKLLAVNHLELILQDLQKKKENEFGISIDQETPVNSVNLEEKSARSSPLVTNMKALHTESDSLVQNELDVAQNNYKKADSEIEEKISTPTLPQITKSKSLGLSIDFNQTMPEQSYLKPSQANYEEMLAWLDKQGTIGKGLSQVLIRLHNGVQHRWNPYWRSSSEKLNKILDALNNLSSNVSLANELDNKDSELYQAINMPRIMARFSLFDGACGIKHSKSLQKIEALDNDLQTPTF
ncbi:hypothetical protein ACQUW5_12060 [Legionella sp. CNM-1927-20]|uniref:hypothetical protein n=1 Tax=Legionella sp. CNM-1927-20 TaxID=3422221 RepID=UPI00403AAB6C